MQFKALATLTIAATIAAQCELGCIDINDPVCGSNGKNYSNDCYLKVDACTTKTNITVANKGDCGAASTNCNKQCPRDLNPQCGSNGITYDNPCLLEIASCMNTTIKLVSAGPCPISGSDACKTPCLEILKQVCGSNGKTYGNECELKNAACDDPALKLVSEGECPSKSDNAQGNPANTTAAPTTTTKSSVPLASSILISSAVAVILALA